jgi:hypothetical protein
MAALFPGSALGQPRLIEVIKVPESTGQELTSSEPDRKKPPKPKPDCLDGVKYDDGKFEKGLRPVLFNDNIVMLFDAPSYPAKIEKICIAWIATSFWKEIYFDLRIWKADGPDGKPGTLLDTIPNFYSKKLPGAARFTNYDVKSYGIVIDEPVYIGPYWDPLQAFLVYVGYDVGPKTKRQRAFYNVGIDDDHAPTSEFGVDALPDYRALGLRVKFGKL